MCFESNCWWNLLIHSTIYFECETLFHLKIFVFFYITNMRVHHEKSRLNPQRQCLSQHFREIDQIWCLKAFFLLISVCCANAKIKSTLFFLLFRTVFLWVCILHVFNALFYRYCVCIFVYFWSHWTVYWHRFDHVYKIIGLIYLGQRQNW